MKRVQEFTIRFRGWSEAEFHTGPACSLALGCQRSVGKYCAVWQDLSSGIDLYTYNSSGFRRAVARSPGCFLWSRNRVAVVGRSTRLRLKYGCNPHQAYAAIDPIDPTRASIRLLSGAPSFINVLDALNAWQLVREARLATGMVAAASFKHVSPAGAAVAMPLSAALAKSYEVDGQVLTPAALAYVRARGADPKSSFGDFAALSDIVDLETAEFLKGVVSDGIVAPGFEPEALETLKRKKNGSFVVIEADAGFEAPMTESREVFGMRLVQDRNNYQVSAADLADVVCGTLTPEAVRDLLLGLVAMKYTQSNSVGYVLGGQVIGIGAGQQSRVDCTKMAGDKAKAWWLSSHPKVLGLRFKKDVKKQERINWRVRYIEGDLTAFEERAFYDALDASPLTLSEDERREWLHQLSGVSLVSDGFIPFRDNIDHARKHGVRFIAEPGGSTRDKDVEDACREYGIALAHTHLRLFHH
jgi:phosphoribosylaminoimidazolecarboxamide formyltransferase / IMP cyclohydrolase